MNNNYLQEEQKIINKINRSFFENVAATGIYLLIFRGINRNFPGEQKFFMHLTGDQGFMSKLLVTFSSTAICAIFLSTVVYLTKRFFLKKYRHIRSNLFFLNNGWVAALNCLLKICGYTMLILSFMSLPRLLLTLIFISLFSLLEKGREFESQLSPGFFSWEDTKLRSLFAYSLTIAVSFPIYDAISATRFVQKLKDNINKTKDELGKSFPPEVDKIIRDTLPNIPFGSLLSSSQEILGKIISSKETKGAVLAIVLFGFAKDAIDQSILSFGNFWKEVAATAKRVEWFKLFSNFQLAASVKKARNFTQGVNGFPILCYESFALNPNFIKQAYVENIDSFDREFARKIESVNEFIRMVNGEVSEVKERSFILYWVFNRINSFQDFFLYNESIKAIK